MCNIFRRPKTNMRLYANASGTPVVTKALFYFHGLTVWCFPIIIITIIIILNLNCLKVERILNTFYFSFIFYLRRFIDYLCLLYLFTNSENITEKNKCFYYQKCTLLLWPVGEAEEGLRYSCPCPEIPWLSLCWIQNPSPHCAALWTIENILIDSLISPRIIYRLLKY